MHFVADRAKECDECEPKKFATTWFRVYVSDGSVYDVKYREFAYVTSREFIVGIDIGRSGIPRRSAYLDLLHVTRIEPLANDNGESNGQQRSQ